MTRRIRTIVFNRGHVQAYLMSLPERTLSPRRILAMPAILLIRLYQAWSHSQGRNICPNPHPNNCSNLGVLAYVNHGLAIGTVLVLALLGEGLFKSNKDRQAANAQSQPPPSSPCP